MQKNPPQIDPAALAERIEDRIEQVRAYNDKLNEAEKVPDCFDYNEVLSILGIP